jgi:hypothetical protein
MEITLANREMRGKEQCSFFGVLILGKLYAIGTLIGSVGAPLRKPHWGWKPPEKGEAATEQFLFLPAGQRSQKRILSEVFNGARRGT